MLVGKVVLLTLAVERDLRPVELAVGVAERAGALLLALRRSHALRVADAVSVLDLAADFLLVGVGQAAAVLDVIGECMKGIAVGFQQARDGAQRGKGFALAVRCQQADRFAKLGSELARQCHGSSPPAHRSLWGHMRQRQSSGSSKPRGSNSPARVASMMLAARSDQSCARSALYGTRKCSHSHVSGFVTVNSAGLVISRYA